MHEISQETILKAAAGDRQAFEVIYRQYFSFVSNVAVRVVNRPEDAEDVAQEVFMNIYRNLKKFGFRSSLKTWIYRVAMNTAINYSRKKSREQKKKTEYASEIESHRHVTRDERGRAGEEYLSDSLEDILSVLNPAQRACILLRGIEGLSYQEIARTLGVPVNTVRSRIKRAREAIWRQREVK